MTATQTQQGSGVWTIDKVHSSVRYAIEHNGTAQYRGSFSDVDASLEYGDDGVAIKGSVKLDSVDLKDEQQKGHVLSPDFFDAARYPTADFESTNIQIDGTEVVVDGLLTLRGQSKPLSIRGSIGEPGPNLGGTETIAVHLATTINRQDYGVSWNTQLPNGSSVLGDEVAIEVVLELVQG
ncbi:MAG: YceI family protein [Solirubrobacterales bacterium]